jgi:chromosome segregation ATPase
MQVPSTQIYTDSLAENKKLREEIALLKQEKETVKREVEQYEAAKVALIREFGTKIDLSEIKDAALETIRHGLRKDNNDLRDRQGKYEREIISKKAEKDSLEKRLVEVSQLLADWGILLSDIKAQIAGETLKINSLKSETTKKSEELFKQIADLNKQKESARQDLNNYKTEYEQKKNDILKNEDRLANKAADMNIYEARLRSKWSQMFPETEMIL